ncbi:cytochrome c biogenesis CcdA family protein [Natronobiforma cellulositropha]|uniref:cytochrome c biogenesis CcdA family protein n=1 Tax=Natronobiforma cellulositropha TaxID=1679076 RepID=UPI0021D5969E|nr:cytochrome c biogenesis protein CcdA [Natronobiforma cellulositropha]
MSPELFGAVAFAFLAGVATFFAPCSYALLPGYVGYYVAATGERRPPLAGALVRGSAAAVGALTTFGLLAAVAVVAGSTLERALPFLEYGVGVALVLVGLWVLYGGTGAVHVLLPRRRASVTGFAAFGAAYSLAATACVLPLFLALVLRSLTMSPAETVAVVGAYASGFAALLLAVTVAVAVGYDLSARRVAGYSDAFVRLAGVVLVVAGVAQLAIAGG